ncbi:MAG: acyl-CoA dehydratase activase-related protein, partial [Nitrospirae bacterium]|nr:acyl-CoA dehydratase activase-related protein [Nitrospirota bacterium]
LGLENAPSDACFPVKVSHGHIKYLKDSGIDAIFLPSFVNLSFNGDEYQRSLACPHTQTIPYVSKTAIDGLELICPVVDSGMGQTFLEEELFRVFREYGIKKRDVAKAISCAASAQDRFTTALRAKGADVLKSLSQKNQKPAIVIVGRGYNAFDSGVNLEIPKKLSHIDALSIPMDFLPLEGERLYQKWPNMYWRSGQKILRAARIIRNTPGLYAIYIGNFSCGPDSFILKYFKEEMKEKPFLHIEIDEHSADAGAVTRCEAFLDSVTAQRTGMGGCLPSDAPKDKNMSGTGRGNLIKAEPFFNRSNVLEKRTVYIPMMSDHAYALKAAFESCGVSAEVLPESDKESIDIGRKYASGKECYPYLVTAGDMLKKVFSADFVPEKTAFFMPSGTGPCRFGQYNVAHKLILEKLGLKDVPIFAPNQDVQFYKDLGIAGRDFPMRSWKGIIAYELLLKCLYATRPYEKIKGDADAVYRTYHEGISHCIKSNNGGMEYLLKEMRKDFESVIPIRIESKPLIGIVGEIFVRSNRFSNEDLVRKVESLGGEVWLAPMEEWIYYVNAMSMRKALIKREMSGMINIFLKGYFQKRIEHKYGKIFKGFLKTLKEPNTRDILRKAAPYLHDSFEGETVLSIGKTVDLIQKGAAGIINAMPFGCMPGAIVTSLIKAVSRDYDVPCISIPYDGSESPSVALQIEAFMETMNRR